MSRTPTTDESEAHAPRPGRAARTDGRDRSAGLAVVLLGGPDVGVPDCPPFGHPHEPTGQGVDPATAVLAAAVAERMSSAATATVVAVDSGLHRARSLGLGVDVVVGDMDSVRPDLLEAAAAAGARIVRHPEVKDHTDVALALSWVSSQDMDAALVVGSQLGRLDHLLATTLVLGAPEHAALDIEAWMGPARLHVVHPGRAAALAGDPGELVSLFALGGRALGVTTAGLLYPLHDDVLVPGSTRGTSNELALPTASVSVDRGAVLAVLPGERGTHLDRGLVPSGGGSPTGRGEHAPSDGAPAPSLGRPRSPRRAPSAGSEPGPPGQEPRSFDTAATRTDPHTGGNP